MNKKTSIDKLSIITPFKERSNNKLFETINFIYKQNLNISINHLILYDHSCSKVLKIDEIFPPKENYFLSFISTNRKGIYNAINKGLDNLKKDSYYIVIGAGDLIFLNNLKKFYMDKILMCKYRLSYKNHYINKLRNIYSGMPYCHNAIIFKLNNLRYSERYSICSDYDYFLNFLKLEKINISDNKNFNTKINVVFEAKSGISSRSFFKKNFENLSILLKNKGLKYIFIYMFFNIKKFIKNKYD